MNKDLREKLINKLQNYWDDVMDYPEDEVEWWLTLIAEEQKSLLEKAKKCVPEGIPHEAECQADKGEMTTDCTCRNIDFNYPYNQCRKDTLANLDQLKAHLTTGGEEVVDEEFQEKAREVAKRYSKALKDLSKK